MYAFKSLLMPGSSRDVGDILMSDIPHMVAAFISRRHRILLSFIEHDAEYSTYCADIHPILASLGFSCATDILQFGHYAVIRNVFNRGKNIINTVLIT